MSDAIVVKVPTLGESVVDATVAKIIKNVGDSVMADDPILELETDKVTLEVFAPVSGTIDSILHNQGDVVKVGADLVTIKEGSVETSAVAEPKSDSTTTPEVVKEPESAEEKAVQAQAVAAEIAQSTVSEVIEKSGPAVQKVAAEVDIEKLNVQASGKDGRIRKADLIDALKTQMSQGGGSAPSQLIASGPRSESKVPLSRLRQRIAERLKGAQNTAAILTTFNEVDMSSIMNLRNVVKDDFTKVYGVKLGFMSFFVKACVEALKMHPIVNSRIENGDIIEPNYVDIGVAVSAPQGLVVPVLKDAQTLSFADIEKAIADFGQKAKDGKLTIDDMTGGSFTISNGGTFGSMLSTPILNPPQSAILGMHNIVERPVAVNGQVVIRPIMYVALSYDHRLIDGRDAVTFLVTVKKFLENPGRFALGV